MGDLNQAELTEIKLTSKEFIKQIYDSLVNFLDGIYTFKEITITDLVEPVENIGNLIKILSLISSQSNIEFDTSIIIMGVNNMQKAIDTKNYLLLVDTIEYEVINSLSMFYDKLDD